MDVQVQKKSKGKKEKKKKKERAWMAQVEPRKRFFYQAQYDISTLLIEQQCSHNWHVVFFTQPKTTLQDLLE